MGRYKKKESKAVMVVVAIKKNIIKKIIVNGIMYQSIEITHCLRNIIKNNLEC